MIEQGNIFGGFEAVDESFLNPKGKQSIKQRFREMYGYDAEHICKNCKYCVYTERGRKYYKCRLMGVSASEATDIRLKDVACGMWERKEE